MTERATHLLHRLTSYEPGREWDVPVDDPRLVQDFTGNDPAHFPRFYKRYGSEHPRVALPREWAASDQPATAVLAGTATPAPAHWDLPALARVLFLSAGVVRYAERRGTQWLFRAAGSAGARFPLELYVAVPAGGTLPAGVHWYDPEQHALVTVGPPTTGEAPAVVVTGVPWRTGWRYRERGFRHIYWDAGTMLAQLLALADSAGLHADLHLTFPDAEVARLVGADGVQEWPVALVGLGSGPALTAAGPAITGRFEDDAIEFPLVTAAQHAGDTDVLGDPVPRGDPVPVAAEPDPLDEIIVRRGSVRRLDPAGALPRATVEAAMAAALRGIDVPHWLAVHAVDGLVPGLYRWPDLDAPVRFDVSRADTYRVALEQGLARDASFIAISATELAGLDDHRYREVQLLAGLVEGRLHLMAYSLGAAASGMTFEDAAIPGLLGEEVACLLWTCVGVAEYRSARAGTPGAPRPIALVDPRE